MATKKILIVEDEKPLANAINLKLQSSGFTTHVVHNGDEALDILKTEKFDLMLTDIMMPKRDGFSVLTELQKEGNTMPVLVMSNLGQDEDVKRAKSLGAKDYIIKDTPLVQIVERISSFLT